MSPSLTCFGGVGEIGGNKFLLEDKGVKVILDFGTGFSDGAQYFDGSIRPRGVNGAGDLFEFGMLPEIHGLYSEKALQNTKIKHGAPDVDAVVLSHFHWDHTGRIGYIDPKVPVYCGETTFLIHEAYDESSPSPLRDHEIRKFRTGDRFRVGPMEFVPVHVDHSIPGAYGFVVHTSEGAIAYTGDFRFHGPKGSMTADFVEAARDAQPEMLISEGTRVREGDQKTNMSEGAVLAEAVRTVKGCEGLVFSTFRGNDVDRINTFYKAAEAAGRRLVVSTRVAVLLDKLARDKKLRVPSVGKDVDVYIKRKRTGKLDDKDYDKWERPFLDHGKSAQDVRRKQSGTFLHLEVWDFPELIDIGPRKGGSYIHAATEAFNEEGEREEEVIKNWIGHLGFEYTQLHASGHATMSEVGNLVGSIGARWVVPVHTENPQMFPELKGARKPKVRPPQKGVPMSI